MKERIRVGDRVKAFHPAKVGVVNEGDVVAVGSKYAMIDFGELGGGVRRVPHVHILEFAQESLGMSAELGMDAIELEGA